MKICANELSWLPKVIKSWKMIWGIVLSPKCGNESEKLLIQSVMKEWNEFDMTGGSCFELSLLDLDQSMGRLELVCALFSIFFNKYTYFHTFSPHKCTVNKQKKESNHYKYNWQKKRNEKLYLFKECHPILRHFSKIYLVGIVLH